MSLVIRVHLQGGLVGINLLRQFEEFWFSVECFLYFRHTHEDISDTELERILRKRGSDFDAMLQNHKAQKAFEEGVAKSFKDMGIKVEMASR